LKEGKRGVTDKREMWQTGDSRWIEEKKNIYEGRVKASDELIWNVKAECDLWR